MNKKRLETAKRGYATMLCWESKADLIGRIMDTISEEEFLDFLTEAESAKDFQDFLTKAEAAVRQPT